MKTKEEVVVPILDINELYNELIMAVETKFPGELRHETALRYIKEAQHGRYEPLAQSEKIDCVECSGKGINWLGGVCPICIGSGHVYR